MNRASVVLVALWLAWPAVALRAVNPVPEARQAALAMKVIDAYHGPRPDTPPRTLHLVYFTPADREPADRYEERLDAIMEDVRAFYRAGMRRLGFGPMTFTLARDEQEQLTITLVKSKEDESAFPKWQGSQHGNPVSPEGGEMVFRECKPVLEAAGIMPEQETLLIFCHLATYDEEAHTFRHHSPYFGAPSTQRSGLCFVADWAQQDLANLTRKEPMLNDGEFGNVSLGKHTTIFLGGIAHELGHAFGLPHCGERWDEKVRGTSLMGEGNRTYRDEQRDEGKGSFLTMASAMRLAAHPLFNGSDKGVTETPRLEACNLILSTNVTRPELAGRRGVLRLEGTVHGSPPIYGVIAYFDSLRDGGYAAPAATSVPDAQGRFAIEVSDLAPCGSGELRVEFCHANGAVSTRRLEFSVTPEGALDLSQWETRHALEPVAEAVRSNQLAAAQEALAKLDASRRPELEKAIARKLVATLQAAPRPSPADVPASTLQLPLGDASAQAAEVGWLQPAANRIPANDEIDSPFLDSGRIYATGLYAHSPSRYVFDLGGRWQRLSGQAGLHTAHQANGSVVFVIKTDGTEMFRSGVIRGASKASYQLDVTGVKRLELIVAKAGTGNSGNWGLWLEPTLSREPLAGRQTQP
jgi:NPCBM/NEW2 domain